MNSNNGAAYAEAAVVQDGKFLYVDDLEDALSTAGPAYDRVDLEGRLLAPSFFEAYAHPNLKSCLT